MNFLQIAVDADQRSDIFASAIGVMGDETCQQVTIIVNA